MKQWQNPELLDLSIKETSAWRIGKGNDQYIPDDENCITDFLEFILGS